MRAALCLLLLLVPTPGSAAEPEASLERGSVPAAGRHKTLLHVARFGRYAVNVTSKSGVALQVVDRMAGPGTSAGVASIRS